MLEVQNLVKVYNPKKGVPVKALDNVNLKFEETGMVFILGKSGSGKSTLLNLIGGLDTITSGDVLIKGKSSAQFKQSDFDSYRNTFIGFIFQEYNILNEFSVGKNIALALELQGKKADQAAVDNILAQVDLQGYANRRPNELSGGQKQRIAIARALIKDPEIIMADEPTGALDSNTGRQVFETLQKLSKTKLVIIVSHDRDYAEFYGDRVIEFSDGRVISDIKKYKAQSHAVSAGVSVIDDKIMHVKQGHKFSESEKSQIIGFLEGGTGEIILSKDQKSNVDFRRLARIDAEGNKESFEHTSPKNQKIKQYDPNQLKLIRSRLPNRHALKIAGSSLKVKPVRLFITILLSAIAFGLFGLADTVGAYNKYEATYNSMRQTGINYASFSKGIGTIYEDGYIGYASESQMTDTEANEIKSKFPNSNFDEMRYPGYYDKYNSSIFSYADNVFEQRKPIVGSSKIGMYYTHGMYGGSSMSFGGIIEVKPEHFSSNKYRGYNYVGDYPKADDEVMISRHVYEAFKDWGLYDVEKEAAEPDGKIDDYKIQIDNEQQLIGKKIKIGYGNSGALVKIVGIIDTQFPHTYDAYKTIDEASQNMWDYMLSQEISALFSYSYHGALYSRPGVIDKLSEMNERKYLILNNNTYLGFPFGPYRHFNFNMAASKDQLGDSLTAHYANPSKTTLGGNEALISFIMARELLSDWNSGWPWHFEPSAKAAHKALLEAEYLSKYNEDMFIEYVMTDVLNRGSYYDEDIGDWIPFNDFDGVEEYMIKISGTVNQYIIDEWSLSTVSGRPQCSTLQQVYLVGFDDSYNWEWRNYAPCGISYYEAISLAETKALMADFFADSDSIPIQANLDTNRARGQSLQINIVGIAYETPDPETGNAEFNYGWGAVFGDDIYPQLLGGETGNIIALITNLPSDKASQMNMIRFSYQTNILEGTDYNGYQSYERYLLKNSVTETLNSINSLAESLAKVFLYVGLGFAVFAAFLLMNFIMVSISYKKKEIGILRAIGAKSSDVFRIFFFESLIIALISFVFAVIGAGIGAYFVNKAMRTELGFIITLLSFGIRQIALVLAVSVGIAAIASFLPVYLAARKKPIETIRRA